MFWVMYMYMQRVPAVVCACAMVGTAIFCRVKHGGGGGRGRFSESLVAL